MKINYINRSLLIFSILISFHQFIYSQNKEIELWESEVPGSIDTNEYNEIHNVDKDQVSLVKTPTLSVFVPKQPNGTAVVICPGGGYAYLAINKEGYKVAEWFNTLGITAFVLKYRLPSDVIMKDKFIGPLQDAQESIRYIKRHADRWQINQEKIDILGFSAGGHLASTLATHYNDKVYKVKDSLSAKPNFSLLIYPVISMTDKIAHIGSRNNLLGLNASKVLKEKFSSEMQTDLLTPPSLLVHATNDKVVPVENSIVYYLALKQNNVSSELHIYQDGKHGFGLGKEGTNNCWTKPCEIWLRINKYIN